MIGRNRIPAFRDWLLQSGAEILPTTNRYELIRFRSANCPGVSILYRRGRDGQALTATGEMAAAIDAFCGRGSWNAGARTVRRRRMSTQIEAILERDGEECFYCGHALDLSAGEIAVEHLCPHAHGGPNHLSNLALAHRECEAKAGASPVVVKVRLRERLRQQGFVPPAKGGNECGS